MLSKYFSYEEMTHSDIAIRKGIDNTPTPDQTAAMKVCCMSMDAVREYLNRPILVSSGLRVKKLNEAAGGSKKSAHMQGYAMDFMAPTFGDQRAVFNAIKASGIKFDNLILEYPNAPSGGWVHISFAPEMRQQCLTTSGGGYVAA